MKCFGTFKLNSACSTWLCAARQHRLTVLQVHHSPPASQKSSSSDTYSSNLSGFDDGFSQVGKKSVVSHRRNISDNMPSGSTAQYMAGSTPSARGAWSGVRLKSCEMTWNTPLVGCKVSLAVAMRRWTGQVFCNLTCLQIGSTPIRTYRQIRGGLPASLCVWILVYFLCTVVCFTV